MIQAPGNGCGRQPPNPPKRKSLQRTLDQKGKRTTTVQSKIGGTRATGLPIGQMICWNCNPKADTRGHLPPATSHTTAQQTLVLKAAGRALCVDASPKIRALREAIMPSSACIRGCKRKKRRPSKRRIKKKGYSPVESQFQNLVSLLPSSTHPTILSFAQPNMLSGCKLPRILV
jgi:hypothetical protein